MSHNSAGIWRRIRILYVLVRQHRSYSHRYLTAAQLANICGPRKPRRATIGRDSTYIRRMLWKMRREGLIQMYHDGPRWIPSRDRFVPTQQGINWLNYQLRNVELYGNLSAELRWRFEKYRSILGRKTKNTEK